MRTLWRELLLLRNLTSRLDCGGRRPHHAHTGGNWIGDLLFTVYFPLFEALILSIRDTLVGSS
jgi:hypothetical protein